MRLVSILDDNQGLLVRYKVLLKQWGYQVSCFTDPILFASSIKNEKPDLIILDYQLSCDTSLDGHNVAVAVRNLYKEVPIFLISGHIAFGIIDKFRDLNINKFIQKSFDDSELKSAVDQIFSETVFNEVNDSVSVAVTEKEIIVTSIDNKPRIVFLDDSVQISHLFKLYLGDEFNVETYNSFNYFRLVKDKKDVFAVCIDYKLNLDISFDEVLKYTKSNFSDSLLFMITGYVDDLVTKKYEKDFVKIIHKPIDKNIIDTFINYSIENKLGSVCSVEGK